MHKKNIFEDEDLSRELTKTLQNLHKEIIKLLLDNSEKFISCKIGPREACTAILESLSDSLFENFISDEITENYIEELTDKIMQDF